MFFTFVTFTGLYVLLIAAISLLLLLLRIPRHRLRRIANAQALYDSLNLLLAYGGQGAWVKLFPYMPVGLSSGRASLTDMRSLKLSKYIGQFGRIGLELELPVSFLRADLQPQPGNPKHRIAELCSRRSVRWREISDPPMPDARHLLHFDFGDDIDAVTEMLHLVLDSKGAEARIDGVRMQIAGIRPDRQFCGEG